MMRFGACILLLSVAGYARQNVAPSREGEASEWVAPGTKGSSINGTAFHAQVLLDVAGFSPGVIDGKNGMSLRNAVRGFQEARGLKVTGELTTQTRQALLLQSRPSTINVKLTPEQVAGPFVYPFPKKAEEQAKLETMGYRNMLEKVAELYHTTPDTIVALNGPEALIGPGQTLRLPNVVPASASYETHGKEDAAKWMKLLNVEAGSIKGDHIVVDKSEGVLKVMDSKATGLVAQFPVTMGSSHDPLPIGTLESDDLLPSYRRSITSPTCSGMSRRQGRAESFRRVRTGPVGVAWLDLTKEHYGIHGTGEPQTIGRAAKPRLPSPDELGCPSPEPDDEAGFQGRLPGLIRGGMSGVVSAPSSSRPCWSVRSGSFVYNITARPTARWCGARSGDKVRVEAAGGRGVTVAESVVVGPSGLAIPVAGVRAGSIGRYLHPGAGGRCPGP